MIIQMRIPANPGERWADQAVAKQIGKTITVNTASGPTEGTVTGGFVDDDGALRLTVLVLEYDWKAETP